MRFHTPRAAALLLAALTAISSAPAQSATTPSTPASDLHLVEFGTDLALRDRLIEVGAVHADFGRYALATLDTAALARLGDLLDGRTVARLPHVHDDEVVVYSARNRAGIAPLHGRLLFSRRAFFLTAARPELLPDDCGGSGFHGGLQAVSLQRPAYRSTSAAPVVAQASSHGSMPDPTIAAMVSQVQSANLQAHVATLSGLFSRRANRAENAQAINYIRNQLTGLPNLTFRSETFNASYGPNVIAEIPGTDLANEIVMIGAHMDSIVSRQSTARAPGADDNASGSAAVLELARIFAGGQFRRTIRFGWWNAEELGLLGADAYSRAAQARGDNIIAYINTDMNSYRASGDSRSVDFVTNDSTSSLISAMQQSIRTYLPGVPSQAGAISGGTSDHRAFFRNGYPAVFIFEDVQQFSPFIHTTSDVIGTSANDFELSKLITQSIVAGAAEFAEISVANPGVFTTFGQGCNGTGTVPGPCGGVNATGGALTGDTRTNEYAYLVPNPGTSRLLSFEVLSSSTGGSVTVPAYVYANNGGSPSTTPLATTSVTIGPVSQFYRATLTTPITVTGDFWVAVDHSAQTTRLASVTSGETGLSFYRRPPGSGTWLQSGLVTRPAVRSQCEDSATNAVPQMGSVGVPLIGRSYQVTVAGAVPLASAVCLIGQSDQVFVGGALPVTIPSTGGCQLLVSNEATLGASVDASGAGSIQLTVPNNVALVGSDVFHQWVIIDPTANQLGIVLSAGARATVGG